MENAKHWESFWGNAASITENRPERYAKDITLRYPIYVPFSGEAIRLTFDNFCGTESVTISKVTVLYNDIFYPVTYNNEREMQIPAGDKIVTDVLDIKLEADATIWVSFYLGDFTLMRAGVVTSGPLSSGMYSNGDQTESMKLEAATSRETQTFYFLTNISCFLLNYFL
mgnify:FL=1